MNDLRAQLVIFCDNVRKLFDFNVAYVRDGGTINLGWESGGIFSNTHDALEEGREWMKQYKDKGYKRGNTCLPWRKKAA